MLTFNRLRKRAEMQHYQPSNPNSTSADHYAQLYNAQQSSSYAHQYSYHPHQTHNSTLLNPSTLMKHHEISSGQYEVSPETGIRPPGIDSYAAMNSYLLPPPTHVSSVGQVAATYGHHGAQVGALSAAAFYQDTGAPVQNWAVKESIQQFGVDPVSYAAAIQSLNKESEVPMSSTPMVWNNWSHPLAYDATQTILTKTDVTQTVWCEACKIECNSKDVYAQHILGKKHERNLKKQGEVGNPVGGKMVMGNRNSAFCDGMESKKQKLVEGGAAFDSTWVCTICNITCNSQVVFNSHLTGKRHAIQASLRPYGTQPLLAANPNPLGWSKPKTRPAVNGTWKKGTKKTKVVQSVWCEICKIDCNSKDVLDKHKLGKKHKKNQEKLEESKKEASAPAAKDPVIGPKENPAADKGKTVGVQQGKMKGPPSLAPGEDLETKRRKLMEAGTTADAVRVCTVCDVVCNSQTVFAYHLAGHKHTTNMGKKQAEAAAGTVNPPGPGLVTAS